MPGIRKPTNVHELRGSFKKNPQRGRERANEPKDARDVGKPPRGLGKEVKAAWRELVDAAIPGVLRYSDRPTVLAAAYLYARMKEQQGTHQAKRSQLIDLVDDLDFTNEASVRSALIDIIEFADQCAPWRTTDQANLTQLLARLGMTPADRSKIVIPKAPEANPFDDV